MSYIKKQSDNETKKLFGINGWNVQKKKGYNHISDFKKYKENGTEISKYIWKLKNNNIDYKLD